MSAPVLRQMPSGHQPHMLWTRFSGRTIQIEVSTTKATTIKRAPTSKCLQSLVETPVKFRMHRCYHTLASDVPLQCLPNKGGTDCDALLLLLSQKCHDDKPHPPANGDLGIPKKLINNANPNNPKTIEGTAARLFILTQ